MMKQYKKNKMYFLTTLTWDLLHYLMIKNFGQKYFIICRSGQVYVLAHLVCQCHVRNMLLSSHNYIRSNTRGALSSILTRGKMTSDVFQGTGLTRSEIFLIIKVWFRLFIGLMNKTHNDNDDENDEKIVVCVVSDAIICTLHYKACSLITFLQCIEPHPDSYHHIIHIIFDHQDMLYT